MAGAPAGNQNAARAKKWREAILRALARKAGSVDAGLDATADKLVALAYEGDKWAIEHAADRIDGKAPQSVALSGDEDGPPIKLERVIRLVKPDGG